MKLTTIIPMRAIASGLFALVVVGGAVVPSAQAGAYSVLSAEVSAGQNKPEGDKKPEEKVQISSGERDAAKKIQSATDAGAKLQAAGEFIKKYPKSQIRQQVAEHVLGSVTQTQDSAQRITLGENYMSIFTDPAEADLIFPVMVDSYIKAQRLDDAFRISETWIQKNPNDVATLTQMTLIGTDQIRRSNPKFLQPSQQYGTKAIQLIEANQKPATLDDLQWGMYRTRWLPELYQAVGIMALVTQNLPDAKAKFEKAISLKTTDPTTFVLLGGIYFDDYSKLAQQYNTSRDAETLKKAEAQLDLVIDAYARAVALTEGKPELAPLRDQVMPDLQTYYKFRNKNSVDGLQQLIDKYKVAQ